MVHLFVHPGKRIRRSFDVSCNMVKSEPLLTSTARVEHLVFIVT